MSRTIKEIYNEAVAERNRRLELAEFASDSKLSVMNGILWVVAAAIYSFETLLDVFAVDISEAINGRINGTPAYYANALLQNTNGCCLKSTRNWQKTGTGKNLPEECWRKNSRRQKLGYGRSLSGTAGRTCRQKVITSNALNGIVRKNNKKQTNHVRQDITNVLRHRPVEKGH